MANGLPDGFYLRTLEEKDVPEVVEIVNYVILNTLSIWRTEPDTVEARKTWLKNTLPKYPAFGIFEASGALAGFTSASSFRYGSGYDRTVECAIACRNDYTGKGLGHHLLQKLLSELRVMGYYVVIAGISGTNQGSARFFAREGFKRTGFMPGVGEKNGVSLDLELWQLDLRPPPSTA
ncbi:SubName: Full=Related to putative acetyltransferase-Clavibacter michiganensis subsp. sepedonicus {ECO:0000313/EMBL:CCA70498.1} [Serendipita indica DSM 11827]|uniref:Related to putative acetyltransferase-Clavibacter michiganensis subsp. sepedonicus n=1 Tax=Serendipita indica (strain DSM 11827) TaxID=1109443 RepID=G4TGQ5_SERID|nr:SubName: Full=Related to putative acetyltransferase-Clavibacter michiganensis subsp. sepedonicus {ECO:0000313/EMBL:CCA70498.1} [Serendipita indica DSM 11827]CCA70498.1 related to putative acetyltransferase-Clavibacter michiganensis subsp. sepedonicus [Serendipita indica DSM 11827]